MTDKVYKIPKPNWDWTFEEDVDSDTLSLVPTIDRVIQKFWEIEEAVLVTSVVEILRTKGYIVIEPKEEQHGSY